MIEEIAEEKVEEKVEEVVEENVEEMEIEVREDMDEVEAHEDYVDSDQEKEPETLDLYDPNVSKSVDVNSKNKVTSLKKIILESIGLYKKANIILLK